jgi:hypothetical protein
MTQYDTSSVSFTRNHVSMGIELLVIDYVILEMVWFMATNENEKTVNCVYIDTGYFGV